MNTSSALTITQELGLRLKRARLNANLTQEEVARQAGLSRKMVLNAEKGKVPLEAFVRIMMALKLTEHLSLFLPEQALSPVQLAQLLGKQRQRASSKKAISFEIREDDQSW